MSIWFDNATARRGFLGDIAWEADQMRPELSFFHHERNVDTIACLEPKPGCDSQLGMISNHSKKLWTDPYLANVGRDSRPPILADSMRRRFWRRIR